MKKSVLTLIICLSAFFMSRAQEVVEDNFRYLQVSFSVGELKMEKIELQGRVFT